MPADVVRVRLPRDVNRVSDIALLAGLVLPAMVYLAWNAPSAVPGYVGVVRVISGAAGGLAALGSGLLLARSVRWRRRANDAIERAAADEAVSDEELCVAAAVLGGGRRGSVRSIRRAHLEAVEAACGRSLPRVWLLDRAAERAFSSRPAETDGAESWFKAESSPTPPSSRVTQAAFVAGAVVGAIAVQAMVAAGWLAQRPVLMDVLIGAVAGAFVTAPVRAYYRSAGWWLKASLERVELLLLDRRGEPVRDAVEIDPVGTIVLVHKRRGDSKIEGGVQWRLLPPAPAPAIDAADLQRGLAPWSVAGRQHPAL